MPEQSIFDTVANTFSQNIDQNLKGRIRRALIHRDLRDCVPGLQERALDVLDVGSGTGHTAIWFAAMGHRVTALEPSQQMLQLALENQARQPQPSPVNWRNVTLDVFGTTHQFDLVMAHAVLEWTDNPDQALVKLWQCVKPGGYLSIAFFNTHGRRIKQMMRGEIKALRGHLRRGRAPLTPRHWFCPDALSQRFSALGGTCLRQAGLRCVSDFLPPDKREQLTDAEILALEDRYRHQLPFQLIAPYVHQIWHRPHGDA